MKRLLPVLLALLTVATLFLSSLYSYLLFHTLAEMFSIVIACGIFMIAWNSREFLKTGYLLFLGVAWLFVAILDLVHTLAYKGMNVLHYDDANFATQLWISARFVESVSLLIAPLFLRRALRAGLALATYAVITAFLLLSIFGWRVFPDCFIEGQGLTLFKKLSEVAICLMLAGAGLLLVRNRNCFDNQILRLLVVSIALMILSELTLIFYVDVYGLLNMIGHYFKIVAFYVLYKAVIETSLTRPYALLLRENRERENALREAKEQLDKVNAELERRVAERTASLQEATEDLNRFVNTMAHDLRAPLRAQHGFARILLESQAAALSPQAKGYTEKIIGAAERLDAMISDLLAYLTISRDHSALSNIDLRLVVNDVIRGAAQYIEERGAIVSAESVAGVAMGNEESARLAVKNLLHNALQFVAPGIAPRVRLWTEGHGHWLRLCIEDNGIGIAPEHREKLFGIFQRLHPEGKYSGRGIGLALVRKCVERMGGRLGVESEPGKGSRFWFDLRAFDAIDTRTQ